MLLFSATYKEPVRAFAERIIPDPIVIKLREEELTLSNIRQYFMVCQSMDEQYRALCNLYSSFIIGQVMIFCQVRPLPGRALHCPSPSGNGRNGSFYNVGKAGSSQDPQNKGADPRGVLETTMSSLKRSRGLWRGKRWPQPLPVCADPADGRLAGREDEPGRAPGGHPDSRSDRGAAGQRHPALP